MSDEENRGVPQNALHLKGKSGRREAEHATEKTASQMGHEGTSPEGGGSHTGDEGLTEEARTERESKRSTETENRTAKEDKGEFEERSESTEGGGTGPNETLNKV